MLHTAQLGGLTILPVFAIFFKMVNDKIKSRFAFLNSFSSLSSLNISSNGPIGMADSNELPASSIALEIDSSKSAPADRSNFLRFSGLRNVSNLLSSSAILFFIYCFWGSDRVYPPSISFKRLNIPFCK